MFGDVLFVLDEPVLKFLLQVGGGWANFWGAINYVHRKVETVQVVQDYHVERCRRGSFLFVSSNVQIAVVRPAVGQAVNEPGVPVIGEDDGLVRGKEHPGGCDS